MNAHSNHDLDELSEALDGRLPQDRRARVEERLRSCPECGAAYEAMDWARAQSRRSEQAIPPALEDEIRHALDREGTRTPRTLRRAAGLAVAAALLMGLTVLLTRVPPQTTPLPEAAAGDLRAWADGRLPLTLETAEPSRLESHFAAGGLGFRARVFDLGMMGYSLHGGRLHRLAGRPSALFIYRETSTGREVICQMLQESPAALPPSTERREHDGIPFQVYSTSGITLVFWPEGDVLCVLAGDGDPEAIVQLAFAKAMKAQGPKS